MTDERGDGLAFVMAWDATPDLDDPSRSTPLAGVIRVPDEPTEVVYVYTGLRHPATMQYRELSRRDLDARFGAILLRRALDPDVLAQLFGAARQARRPTPHAPSR